MKEVIGKSKLIHSTLPRKVVIIKIYIIVGKKTANKFNNLFINIGPNLPDDIPTATRLLISNAFFQLGFNVT